MRYANREVEQFLNCWKNPNNRHKVRSQADERTLRRWQREYRERIQTWTAQLRGLLLTLFGKQLSLTNIPDAVLDQLRQVIAEFNTGYKHRTLLGLAQFLLFPHHVCPA
jgi:hypothetical protein